MILRDAKVSDIAAMHVVRMSVKENKLSDPSLVREADYRAFIIEKGRGWVAEADGLVVGFCIVDFVGTNLWALFVRPDFEAKGIGKRLHQLMLDWYFHNTEKPLELSTDPSSRAAAFYRLNGWRETGYKANGEIVFEIEHDDYKRINAYRR